MTRKAVREKLALELSGAMPTAQVIYDHKPAEIDGHPAVMVLSAGTSRDKSVTGGFSEVHFLEIHNLVLYADPNASWTEEEAEDLLDQLEYELSVWMDDKDNMKNDVWRSIRYAARSIIGRLVIGGTAYQDEIVPIVVFVP